MNKIFSYTPIKQNFLLLIFVILVFVYDYFVDYLSSIEELLAVITIISLFFIKRIKLLKAEYTIIGLLLFILIIGLLSNFFTSEKIVIKAIALDLVSFFKAFVVYFGIRIVFKDITFVSLYPSLKKMAYLGLFLILLLIVADLTFHIFPRASRFGFRSLELYFTHPSRLSFAISFIFLVLLPYYLDKLRLVLVFVLVVGLVTLRVKYFGFALISLFFIFYQNIISRVSIKVIYFIIAIAPIALFFVFKDWVLFYFSDEAIKLGWSRAVLLKYSFVIGYDFFPLGTGFGSYGSFFSGPYYSWVYHHYSIHNVWGIMPKHYQFVADQYWPMVLGQFGFFGLIAMIGVITTYIYILLSYFKSLKNKFLKNSIIAGLLGLILLLVDSSSDAIFSQNRGVAIFIFIALIINSAVAQKNENITD